MPALRFYRISVQLNILPQAFTAVYSNLAINTLLVNYSSGEKGALTYYNEKTGKWIEGQEPSEGALPVTDLFLTIGSKHILLNPETYSPCHQNTYWKNPGASVISGFILTGGSRAADDLGYAQLYIQAQNMGNKGYMQTLPRSDWLYNAYGIEAGFYDSRFNTDLGILFIKAYKKFNEHQFLGYALQYGDFFLGYANSHHYSVLDSLGEEGWLVQDYHHENENYQPVHTSLNHQLHEMRFLYELGEITGAADFTDLGNKMLKGIEITCLSWIRKDNNLHYCYYANGKLGGTDYPYLTYNDLFHLQKIIRRYWCWTQSTSTEINGCKKNIYGVPRDRVI